MHRPKTPRLFDAGGMTPEQWDAAKRLGLRRARVERSRAMTQFFTNLLGRRRRG